MLFGLFKIGDNKKQNEQIEYIEILNEKGKKVSVDKNRWLKKLNETLDKSDNIIKKCDLLETAMVYGLAFDVVEPCLKLYQENSQNKRCVDLIFQCYMNNNMYNEAIDIYEKYLQDGKQFTYAMYYDLALAQEKIKDYKGMEKNLFLSFTANNNYIKAIDKLKDYIKKQSNINYYEWLKDLTKNFSSWYLFMELAKLEYSMGEIDKGVSNLLKSLDLNNSDSHLLKVANILISNKRFVEFDNYIIPKYNINSDNINLHQSILNFYFKDNQCNKGLELLHEMYKKNKRDDFFAECEKKFLKKKLKLEEPSKYDSMVNDKGWGKIRSLILTGPIYKMLFKDKLEKRNGKSILILPFNITSEYEIPERVKNFSKNIHIFLNEKIYLLTQLQNKALLNYDDLGVCLQKKEYGDEYFKKIKQVNPNLDMILTGQIKVLDNIGSFEFKIYTYDLNENQKIDMFIAKSSIEVYYQIINKFFNTSIERISNCIVENKDINDKKFMQYYSDYMDIILNTYGYNNYRIYTTDRILKYCLTTPDTNKISMALSLIYKQSKVLPEIRENYKQLIYDAVVKGNYSENLVKQFNYVYGEIIKNEEDKK